MTTSCCPINVSEPNPSSSFSINGRGRDFIKPFTSANQTNSDESASSLSSLEDNLDFDSLDNSAMLKYISDILMEEDAEGKTCMLQDCLALQAAEKPFYEALGQKYPYKGSEASRIHLRDEEDPDEEERSSKQSATYLADTDALTEIFDAVLLCPPERNDSDPCPPPETTGSVKPTRGKRRGHDGELMDLWGMLNNCAQAVASSDRTTANELLKQISYHSSPHGDVTQRLASYFSVALEARLVGLKTPAYQSFPCTSTKMADILKAYQMYVKACPFHRMSFFFANRTILKLSQKAKKLHVIDFGILYGFQWPCLIQRLSERVGGPPKLKITAIELPQPGFKPAQRVEETANRLKKYCERFKVAFECVVIAKKWESIELKDIEIEEGEMVVVNSMFRMKNIPDGTVDPSSPRDRVLELVRRMKPEVFIFGAVNGTYNAPFFVTRFREALFYFFAMFDMFDAAVARDDEQRLLYEKEIYGRDIMNTIACEGAERVDRPESYKQWQSRTIRAGFRQLPLDHDLVTVVKAKISQEYHKDYLVDQDAGWLLYGWKGRIAKALSIWKPA